MSERLEDGAFDPLRSVILFFAKVLCLLLGVESDLGVRACSAFPLDSQTIPH
jgi:hypothetical protein